MAKVSSSLATSQTRSKKERGYGPHPSDPRCSGRDAHGVLGRSADGPGLRGDRRRRDPEQGCPHAGSDRVRAAVLPACLQRSDSHRRDDHGRWCLAVSDIVDALQAAAPAAPTTTPETPTLPDTDRRTRLLPPYKVLLHNDDHNT